MLHLVKNSGSGHSYPLYVVVNLLSTSRGLPFVQQVVFDPQGGRNMFGKNVTIDLGTANTLVFVKGQGIVLSEPSVVAIDNKTDKVVAVGSAAKRMLGRTPGNIVALRPLKDGVIADFEVTEKMLSYFIRKAQPRRRVFRSVIGPRVVVCVPSGVTGVELLEVKEATESAGARQA